jgi:SPASM domain peptide maturase of grasp-with-spasm system
MKKINLKSIKEEGFGKLNGDNMKKIVGGYTLNTVTVTPSSVLYLESLDCNNCLNKKIAIDRFGKIRNCPSMSNEYGDIKMYPNLKEIVESKKFQYFGKIKKDDISICKECELRYACIDCRAYLSDPKNLLSKPAKCNYNP